MAIICRLNLATDQRYKLKPGGEEVNGVCTKGAARLGLTGRQYHYGRLDSFYTTEGNSMTIKAKADYIFYTGASVGEDYETPFFRVFNLCLPLGEIYQIHGEGVGQREVFVTLNQEIQTPRLVVRLTWGDNGAWTGWPPYQHEADLEETYRYFDVGKPRFGLHLSYTTPGGVGNIVVYPTKSGSMVLAPRSYHPMVASPGTRNARFWVSTAHSHKSCSYDLAVPDPGRK